MGESHVSISGYKGLWVESWGGDLSSPDCGKNLAMSPSTGRGVVLVERLKRSCGTAWESPDLCLQVFVLWCASAKPYQLPFKRGA